MPTNLTIPISSACSFILGDEQYYMAIAPVFQLPFDKLPLDANLRRAKKKAKVIQEMLITLEKTPQDFLKLNFGIVLIAEKAHINYNAGDIPVSISVEMLTGLHGVANGGHTLEAIRQAFEKEIDLTEAYVAIRVNVGVTDESLKSAVVGLNRHENVDRRSIMYKFGELDNLEASLKILGYKHINYFQNQAETELRRESPRQNISFVIKILMLIDKKQFNPDDYKHPIGVVAGGQIVYNKPTIQRAEELILDFLPTLIKIDKLVCELVIKNPKKLPGVKPLKEDEKLWLLTDNTPIACKINSTFSFPIISAFRAFINNDAWKIPVDDLMEEIVRYLYKDYAELLRKEYNRNNMSFVGITRGQEIWLKMYSLASKYYTEYMENKLKLIEPTNGKVDVKELKSKV